MVSNNLIDIKENDIIKYDKELLPILLKDQSSKQNIIWATDNYMSYGEKFVNFAQILDELITGKNGNIIKPRIKKNKDEQISRIRDKGEVFTPSWICNKQNNLADDTWFCSKNIFNYETEKNWKTNHNKIPFPTIEGKSWKDYVKNVCLEISCGEAPYLVSRYDAITGKTIHVSDRIGLLDRKLRIVSENTDSEEKWNLWAKIAYKSIYGYEWQGDSLLIARENLLFTFIDYYQTKFHKRPTVDILREIAKIISWNIWQMDGLKGVIPNSCICKKIESNNLFGEEETTMQLCEGCKNNNIYKHNGIYCKIKDWNTGGTLKFISLLKQ